MATLSYFVLDRVSSRKYGLYITGNHVHSAPERDLEFIAVPGRNGDLILDNGGYKNIEMTFSSFFKAQSGGVGKKARQMKEWLLSRPGEYLPLETSYDLEYFRLATFTGPLDMDSSIMRFGKTDISFQCKPWLYMKEGQRLQDVAQSRQILNPRSFSSLPYIKITGTGNIRLTIGSHSWDFAAVDGYIEIDSEIMNTFRGTMPQNSKKTGPGYPVLSPGVNRFAWTGSVTKIEVIPKWRTL